MTKHISAFVILLTFAVVVSGCATTEEKPASPSETVPAPSTSGVQPPSSDRENVDMTGLERSLGLTRPEQELGYKEAAFNTCEVGFGFSSAHNCRRLTMAVINFRLQCRDSEGTISTALGAGDLHAISSQGVHWTLQKQDGATTSDGQGYATVRGLFPKSPKNDWLRIMVNTQFLNMRAQTISRVVAPRPWCHPE